jgi:hypothetical protein
LAHPRRPFGISLPKAVVFVAFALLATGLKANAASATCSGRAGAFLSTLQVELPSIPGWKIEAVDRGGLVTCSARPAGASGQEMTVLAGTYRGGEWFMGVVSRDRRLESGIQEAPAYLYLNSKHVATGKVLAVGDSIGGKRTATYVRFDFPAIDAYVKDIKTARLVEVKAQGLYPLKLELLSAIIDAIESCQKQSLNPKFWKDAESVCN